MSGFKNSMKVIKGLVLFGFLGISISACFNEPEFSILPEISFSKIEFKETPAAGDLDTLILYINFKDGDGDLGLNDDYLDEPYNDFFYFLSDGLGDTTKFSTSIVYTTTGTPYFLLNSGNATGKLVTNRTRLEPNYGYLPEYDPNSCLNYNVTQLLVPESTVDASYNIVDTLENQANAVFYVIEDEALLFEKNIYHNNIDVKFLVNEGGNFVEFDWYKEFCIDFNGRFPFLPTQNGPLEGTIRYAMPNSSFLALFSIKELKLEVMIRDRALNQSKKISTPAFTLDGIRAN